MNSLSPSLSSFVLSSFVIDLKDCMKFTLLIIIFDTINVVKIKIVNLYYD